MSNVAFFSKILSLVIFCQWMMFCSARDGGVIVPMASTDELSRVTRSSYVGEAPGSTSLLRVASLPLLSCRAEFNAELEQGHLSLDDASEHVLPPPLPTSLARASSLPVDSKKYPMLKSGSSQAEMYTLESRAGAAVVAISVFSGSDREGPIASPPLALTLPNEGGADDEFPAASPITRAAPQISSFAATTLMTLPGEFKSPEDLAHFRQMIGPMVTAILGVIIRGERNSVETVKERIATLGARIWDVCHYALDEAFIWGSIPASSAPSEPAYPYLTRGVIEERYLVRRMLEKLGDPKEDLNKFMSATITREAFKHRLDTAMAENESLLAKLAIEQSLLKEVAIVTKPVIPQYYGGGEC